ncbi:MAG: glycosyltransferase, exosortase A system-associated [Azoarcus sp.]|jgi:PEP-CTERM/exosortase A-associated glycosyltransferase|nr:glycosyltransferase, exosortase A system-associated [Azoarcus sp.]
MRILHVLDHSLPLHSGYAFRTAAILREQQMRGWETLHLTSPRQGRTAAACETVDGIEFHRSPLPPAGSVGIGEWRQIRSTAVRLLELAAAHRPDLIHAHSPVLTAIPALWVGKKLAIPVVYEIRAFWEDAAAGHGTARTGGPRYRLTRWLETSVARRVAHVFTICEGLRADLIERGIAGEHVTVVPNAVDVTRFRRTGKADPGLRHRLGLDAAAAVLGFVGSFYAYEGIDLLIDALPGLLVAHPGLRLLLVGGGPQEENLRAHAAGLGLAGKVIFAGRVPQGEVGRYYEQIDLLVYPRRSMRLTELVTPLKPLEAMAQGRPLVASDVGGHRELIRDGETGRLFKAGDVGALVAATIDMLEHRERWPAMLQAGRRFVEKERNWKNSVDACGAIYASLARERNKDG